MLPQTLMEPYEYRSLAFQKRTMNKEALQYIALAKNPVAISYQVG